MHHIRSAIAGLLVFGAAAVASAQATTQAPPVGQHAHGMRGKKGPGAEETLFRGIQLSDAEKANIKNVNAKYAPQMKAIRQQMKSQGKVARGDTAAMRARWEANAPQREQMRKLLEAQRADLRAALTPADQAKFDANAQRIQERVAKRAAKRKGFFTGRSN